MTTQMVPATYAYCPLCGSGEFRFVFHDQSRGFHFMVLECRKCALWVTNPRLKQRFFNAIQDIDAHEVEVCSRNVGKYTRMFQLLPPNGKQTRLLGVGCCRGEFVDLALRKGYDAYGIDMVPVFVEYARKTIGERFALIDPGLDAALEKLGVTSFDIISLWDVIEHIDEPIEFCRSLAKLLRPGGSVFIRTPNKQGQMIKHQLLRPWYGDRISYISGLEHIQIFGPPHIQMLAKFSGLKMTRCEPSDVEAYGDRGNFFDWAKRFAYSPVIRSTFRITGRNLGHSLNCVLSKVE